MHFWGVTPWIYMSFLFLMTASRNENCVPHTDQQDFGDPHNEAFGKVWTTKQFFIFSSVKDRQGVTRGRGEGAGRVMPCVPNEKSRRGGAEAAPAQSYIKHMVAPSWP